MEGGRHHHHRRLERPDELHREGRDVSDFQAAALANYGYPDPDFDYFYWSAETANGVGHISANFEQYTTPQIQHDIVTGRQSGYPNSPTRPPITTWSRR